MVRSFVEKPRGEDGLINAGFFVLNREVFDYIEDEATTWEHQPLRNLASNGQTHDLCAQRLLAAHGYLKGQRDVE
jgi:NDP-sugar pyrophosphorylase family protein